MIPNIPEYSFAEVSEQPTRTYHVDFEAGRVLGFSDGLSAMRQAVYLILSTERFKHLIFSWNFGNELSSVLGENMDVAKSEIKRIVTEALTQDERISAVENFIFRSAGRGVLEVGFDVITVFGTLSESLEVKV